MGHLEGDGWGLTKLAQQGLGGCWRPSGWWAGCCLPAVLCVRKVSGSYTCDARTFYMKSYFSKEKNTSGWRITDFLSVSISARWNSPSACLERPQYSYFLSPLPFLACPATHAAGNIPRNLHTASGACGRGAPHLTLGECQAIKDDEQATGAARTPDSRCSSHGSFCLGPRPSLSSSRGGEGSSRWQLGCQRHSPSLPIALSPFEMLGS